MIQMEKGCKLWTKAREMRRLIEKYILIFSGRLVKRNVQMSFVKLAALLKGYLAHSWQRSRLEIVNNKIAHWINSGLKILSSPIVYT